MPEIYERKETKDIAKSRSWLNYIAKKSVQDKNLHVVLTLTKTVAFIKEKPKTLPTVKHGADLIFPRKFLRPDKQYLAIKKVQAKRKTLDERIADMRAYVKKTRQTAKQRISEGHKPNICNFEYDIDHFNKKASAFLAEFKNRPLAPVHKYVESRTIAMTRSPAEIKKKNQDMIKRAFRQFTEADLRKIRNYFNWKKNEADRLDDRAEFFNQQVDFWKKKLREETPTPCNHRVRVRKYTGLYGEPYYYNRRDVFIPNQVFCDIYPEPLR